VKRLPRQSLQGGLPLPPTLGQPASVHVFDDDSIEAIDAALACGRPLLVRGEPGTGKSQLARAAAVALERGFLSAFVDAHTEVRDLLWTYDAVARLAEAQVRAQDELPDARLERLARAKFVVPGPFWWALDWAGAVAQQRNASREPPELGPGAKLDCGIVLLIDEIDKADASVPNGLLETLGQGTFDVPGVGRVQRRGSAPLVILTTNDERTLPAAFVRRCLVLHLRLPENDELVDWLVVRGRVHCPGLPESILRRAASQLRDDRRVMRDAGLPPPGQAEYLDLLAVLAERSPHEGETEGLVERLARFVLRKHGDLGSPRSEAPGRLWDPR